MVSCLIRMSFAMVLYVTSSNYQATILRKTLLATHSQGRNRLLLLQQLKSFLNRMEINLLTEGLAQGEDHIRGPYQERELCVYLNPQGGVQSIEDQGHLSKRLNILLKGLIQGQCLEKALLLEKHLVVHHLFILKVQENF